MTKKKFRAAVVQDDGSSACGIEIPFNPKDVFGKVRAAVRATINRFTFRTTTVSMGGRYWIPLNQKNRAGAGVEAGDQVTLTLELDDEPRTVAVPDDLDRALKKSATARRAWDKLSYTHRREHAETIEGAKRPETRARRLAKTLELLGGPSTKGGASRKTTEKAAGVGRVAVRDQTGKTWDQWFVLLDRAGARKLEHKEIAKLLRGKYELSAWWSQMVTVAYEQERLGRKKHEKPGGYAVSATKTINVSLKKLYRAWSQTRARQRWLPESDFEVRKATSEKSMRITWVDGETHVDAYFYSKGDDKSQIAVQHKKLKSSKSADGTKKMWKDRLASLKAVLEG